MQRRLSGAMTRSIAKSLDRSGEWRSIPMLRGTFNEATRFDAFLQGLSVVPAIIYRSTDLTAPDVKRLLASASPTHFRKEYRA
jgi:hypothetical protein